MTLSRSRKLIRVSLWITASLAGVILLAYLLRWPLLEGTIRREIAAAVREHANAEVDVGTLSGSLITWIAAEDVVLKPGVDAPFREASVRRVRVEYGLFGTGTPVVTAEEARVVLAPGEEPAPPVEKTVREVEAAARDFQVPLSVVIRRSVVVLADGKTIEIDEASASGRDARARIRIDGFGEISAELREGVELEATATEGPVRSVRFRRGTDEEGVRPFELEARVQDQDFRFEGETRLDDTGKLTRVEGRLTVPQGHATVWGDFATGRAGLDADATYALETDLKAEVALKARAEGPLAGPYEEWRVEQAVARARGASFRDLTIDEIHLEHARGTLAQMEWKGLARRGGDRVEGKGIFRWRETAEVEGDLSARIDSLEPYRNTVPDLPAELRVDGIELAGRVAFAAGQFTYKGSVKTGTGSWNDEVWTALEGRITYAPATAVIESLAASGTRFAERLTLAGRVQRTEQDAWQVNVRLETEHDRIDLEGLALPTGDFDGSLNVLGNLQWLQAFNAELPPAWRPLKVSGAASRSGQKARLKLSVETADGIALKPDVSVEEREEALVVNVAPGEITFPGSRTLKHEALSVEVKPGGATLDAVRLSLDEPEVTARLSGSVEWDAETTRVAFGADGIQVRQWAVEPVTAKVAIGREAGEITGELRWGAADADHLLARGQIGKVNDFRVSVLLRRFDRSIVGRVLDDPRLKGGMSADLHVTGTLEKPDVTGTVSVQNVAWEDLPPFSLAVPVRTENGRVHFWSEGEETAYGVLSFDGSVPFPGSGDPVDIEGRLETRSFAVLESLLPKAWIPELDAARLVVEADVSGPLESPVWGAKAVFTSDRIAASETLAPMTGLRAEVVMDASGVVLRTLEGRIGDGALSAEGRWDLWREGRPLELRIEGRELLVVDRRLSRLRLTVKDAKLSYREGSGARLEGEIEIPLAIFHEEFGTFGSGGVVRGATTTVQGVRLLPAEGGGAILPGVEGLDRMALDLVLRTSGECRLENSIVGAMIRLDGRVRGTGAAPAFSGRVRAVSGEIKLPTAIFIGIDSAEVVFPEKTGNVPQVHFSGRVGSGHDAIAVVIDGPLSRPNLILRSDPPREQEELLAVLAFGQQQGAVSDAAIKGFAMKLASQYTAGWPSAEPTQGFFSRLKPTFVDESAGEQSKPWELPEAGSRRGTVVRTEYVFSPWFSIVADSDTDANISGDIKLRLRFK